MATTQTISFYCWDMVITIHSLRTKNYMTRVQRGRVIDEVINKKDRKLRMISTCTCCCHTSNQLKWKALSDHNPVPMKLSKTQFWEAGWQLSILAHTVYLQLSAIEENIICTTSIPAAPKLYYIVDERHKNCQLASSDILWQWLQQIFTVVRVQYNRKVPGSLLLETILCQLHFLSDASSKTLKSTCSHSVTSFTSSRDKVLHCKLFVFTNKQFDSLITKERHIWQTKILCCT